MSNRNLFPGPSGRGRIFLNQEDFKDHRKDVQWTRPTVIFYAICIGVPYLAAVIAAVLAGMKNIAAILIGLAVFVGLIVVLVRWLEEASF